MVEFVKFFFRCLVLVILIRLGQLIADVPKSEIMTHEMVSDLYQTV
jgi:hypothetical protein